MSAPPDESQRTKQQTFKPINKMDLTKFTKQLITEQEILDTITMDARDIWESADGDQWVSKWGEHLILTTHETFWCGGECRHTDMETFLLTPINQ